MANRVWKGDKNAKLFSNKYSDRKAIRRDLRKYLPISHWTVIEQWNG